jgi:hypothetical protein
MIFGAEKIYQRFNKELFKGELPDVVFSWQRRQHHDTGEYTDEIMFDATKFSLMTDREILAMFVHEMCHVWQSHVAPVPSRGKGNYHDKAFAAKMASFGLPVTTTGKPGAPSTGYGVHERIEPGGRFDKIVDKYLPIVFLVSAKRSSFK